MSPCGHLNASGHLGFKINSAKAPYRRSKMPSVRRLTAILAADVAGYSRLMGVDEEGTHERLKGHLGELVNPKIGEHRGRIVKNTGDGFLADFPSVVDAVSEESWLLITSLVLAPEHAANVKDAGELSFAHRAG